MQAAELCLHFALFVMRVADIVPAVAPTFAAAPVALARRFYDAIGTWLETLGVPSRRPVLAGTPGSLSGSRGVA